ncbi:POZ domain-containing protein [Basidiobolus meristosporus CBS 931.73]|uniref:POZ domain-containing protein n=1 Tax=Basidiobolus meristosporus CBS 931.73 TaxID=1314790 RepID=A0A1Y1XTT1_9FUNG|nr:POZ domain-containing protein [Basidiobolus meristosporus CBS 931.73]|eukprot:ORX89171.1 POZ domain-containing protein [Basidiobolus meristosporus CBS 931.73]
MMGYSSEIVLNVGGQYFTTSLPTLRSVPDSMLCTMFSPEWYALFKKQKRQSFAECNESSDSRLAKEIPFIDRDPGLFRTILHYLRTRQLRLELATPTEDKITTIGALRDEARFFGLQELELELEKRRKSVWYVSSKTTKVVLAIVIRGSDRAFHFNKELVQFLPLSQQTPTMSKLSTGDFSLEGFVGFQNHDQLAHELFRFREDSKQVVHKILQLKESEGFGLAGIGVSKISPSEKFWVLLKRP